MLKTRSRKIVAVLIALICLQTQVFATGAGTGSARYENIVTLADGFTYTNGISYNSSWKRVESFELSTSPGSDVYPIVMACDTIYGGMTVSQVTSYAQSLGYNVIGAVNSDFFYPNSGVPCGMVVEDGIFKSGGDGWNAIAFKDGEAFLSESPEVKITLKTGAGKSFTTDKYNKSRVDGAVYLYNSYFSTVSTRATNEGWAVRLKVLEGEMTVSGVMTLEVVSIETDCTAVDIGDGYMVLTSSNGSGYGEVRDMFEVGDTITLTTTCNDERLADADWVCSGGDILISGGEITSADSWDSDIAAAHPRTALGIREDGSVIYYVVDGRSSASAGATLSMLASDLLSKGCVYAINLDGGGSSVMSLRMPGETANTIINIPSDGSPRKCASYILFVTDRASSGAERLFADQAGTIIYAGSSLDLSTKATDAALKPAAVPGDVSYSAGRGTVTGTKYTAPDSAGIDTIELYSPSSGISGESTVYVIENASAIRVSNERADTVYKIILNKGDGRTFKTHLTYMSRDVVLDQSLVQYTCDENIGTIVNGVFTATGNPGQSGNIRVAVAGLTYEIPVEISYQLTDIEGHWAESYIQSLYDAGIVKGVTDTLFMPESQIKRGDFMLMLYRSASEPDTGGAEGFSDVAADMYYADAIKWAKSLGIATGFDDGTFKAEATLTREQAFTFVYRFLKTMYPELADFDTAILQGFSDAASVSEYAAVPVATLISLDIVSGSDGALTPQSTLTRAQMAKILCLGLELLNEQAQ